MLTEILSCQRGSGGARVFLSARPALRCAGTQSVRQAASSWEGGSFRTDTEVVAPEITGDLEEFYRNDRFQEESLIVVASSMATQLLMAVAL